MPIRQMNNPSALIQTIPTLDGNSVTFPSWRNRLQNVLQIQGVLDIVNKTLPRPNNADSKEGKLAVRSPEQRGYNPEDYGADWDALSDMAVSTIQLTLSVDLSIRYIRDHLVYSPTEISLDDAIGALEAHEISTSTNLDFSNSEQVAAAAAKQKGRL
jgi:hypothetical protein